MTLKDIRAAFPIYNHRPDLVYLDSAATALKPAVVIAAELEYYEHFSSNIARGIYPMAEQATEKFESARATVASFIGAKSEEIIFTAGTTDSLNLAARLVSSRISKDSTLIVSAAEHHSDYLPWKELAKTKGALIKTLPVTAEGFLDENTLDALITETTAIVALSAVSNVLGIINPVKELIARIKKINPAVLVIVDAAQAVGHMPLDVHTWDADFVAFSGHKLFGPTGVGVLYGKHELLETFPPVTFGGGMVLDACAQETVYKEVPFRFEAGTPNIAGIIGLGAALKFVEGIGLDTIRSHEIELITYTLRRLKEEFGDALTLIGTTDAKQKSGIISFTLVGVHPHDTAHLLGEKNICVRAGLQCAAPLHEALNLSATTRISLSIYNTEEDIEKLITDLKEIRTIF